MEYLAHLDKVKGKKQLLKEHLSSVGHMIYIHIPPTVQFDDISNYILKEFSKYMGFFHDIGKYSDYFQEYLQKERNSYLKKHANISACFLYNYLYKKAIEFNLEEKTKKIITFLYYISSRSHHDSIKTEQLLFSRIIWNELKVLEKHLTQKSIEIIKDLGLEEKISKEEFCSYFNIQPLERDKANFEYMLSKFHNGKLSHIKWYFFLIYIFSLLIDKDKIDSASVKTYETKYILPNKVTDYLKKKNGNYYKSDLVQKREKARKSMVSVIDSMTHEEIKNTRFFTLTAPTGIGKTLSSLQSALCLQKRIKEIENYTPKIVVAIPFINIIEQNKEEYENIFGKEIKMIVHHRLADFTADTNNNIEEEIPIDKIFLQTESWDGDVVLTTFVQFFQSIFTGRNKLLKKINKLAGSIVILDEVQSIPQEYMPLIGASLQMIAKYYGTRFILMTATQPKVLEFGEILLNISGYSCSRNKVIQLLPDYKGYFEKLARTKFIPILEKKLNNEEFLKIFFNKWTTNKSALIVVNTIKRSIELYKDIKQKIKENGLTVPVYYLSTNIIPKKRREVIKNVKDMLDRNESVILVSTQTIEAGVDLDFDMAFRDFAPLASLIQTAGRVNRSGEKEDYLPVYIIQLGDDNQYVYGLSHRKHTEYVLNKKKEIYEWEYEKIAEEYYELALKDGVDDKSKDIWDAMVKLKFNDVEKFNLIENMDEICDVFIEVDDRASILANALEKLFLYDGKSNVAYDLSDILEGNNKLKFKGKLNIYEIKSLFRLVEGKMRDYIVQIRRTKLKENKPIEFNARGGANYNLFWVPSQELERYYDEDTGFIDKNGEAHIY